MTQDSDNVFKFSLPYSYLLAQTFEVGVVRVAEEDGHPVLVLRRRMSPVMLSCNHLFLTLNSRDNELEDTDILKR